MNFKLEYGSKHKKAREQLKSGKEREVVHTCRYSSG